MIETLVTKHMLAEAHKMLADSPTINPPVLNDGEIYRIYRAMTQTRLNSKTVAVQYAGY